MEAHHGNRRSRYRSGQACIPVARRNADWRSRSSLQGQPPCVVRSDHSTESETRRDGSLQLGSPLGSSIARARHRRASDQPSVRGAVREDQQERSQRRRGDCRSLESACDALRDDQDHPAGSSGAASAAPAAGPSTNGHHPTKCGACWPSAASLSRSRRRRSIGPCPRSWPARTTSSRSSAEA